MGRTQDRCTGRSVGRDRVSNALICAKPVNANDNNVFVEEVRLAA